MHCFLQGCCPYEGWFCCADGKYCADSEEYCKKSNVIKTLTNLLPLPKKLNEIKQDCPGVSCPGGCCPYEGWVCCVDGVHCASSGEFC